VRQFLDIDRASIALYDSERDAFEIVAIALHENTHVGKGFALLDMHPNTLRSRMEKLGIPRGTS
jgi:hypothetical protein